MHTLIIITFLFNNKVNNSYYNDIVFKIVYFLVYITLSKDLRMYCKTHYWVF